MKRVRGKRKKNSGGVLVILIIIFAIAGLFYGFLGSGYGIVASCSNSSILDFARVPPPKLAVAQPEFCKTVYTVKSDSTTVCSGEYKLLKTVDVIPCSNLEDFDGQTLLVNVTFYNSDTNSYQGDDFKKIEFRKKK